MDDFGLWDVIVSVFWFMLLMTWIWLVIAILSDIFRDSELRGGMKALWTLFLVILPWLGALVYLIVRGDSMNTRAVRSGRDREANLRAYIQDAAGGGSASVADEIRRLVELRDEGVIAPSEFEQAKAKALS